MLAASGDMPERMSAGKVMKEPPPASAFWRPAQSPANRRRTKIMGFAVSLKGAILVPAVKRSAKRQPR
jgi:hypothetical protein